MVSESKTIHNWLLTHHWLPIEWLLAHCLFWSLNKFLQKIPQQQINQGINGCYFSLVDRTNQAVVILSLINFIDWKTLKARNRNTILSSIPSLFKKSKHMIATLLLINPINQTKLSQQNVPARTKQTISMSKLPIEFELLLLHFQLINRQQT